MRHQVIFFCYPTICIVSFASFICRQLTEHDSVLEADDSIVCEDASHRALQGVSVAVIVFIAFGMPVFFGYILLKASRDYKRESAEPNQEIAKRMANELDVDGTQGFLSYFFFGSNALWQQRVAAKGFNLG